MDMGMAGLDITPPYNQDEPLCPTLGEAALLYLKSSLLLIALPAVRLIPLPATLIFDQVARRWVYALQPA
jgi:hypothetical protein